MSAVNVMTGARPARRLTTARCLAGAGALGFVAGAAAFVWGAVDFGRDVRRIAPSFASADGVVALTGGPERILDAAMLMARGRAPRMLISGVNQTTTRADLAREMPRYSALVECCVDFGYLAENTHGNAVETAAWSRRNGLRSVIVVTSDYHMPRALAELRETLPEAQLLPHPVRTPRLHQSGWWRDPEAMRLVSLEYAKYLRTLARTWVGPRWSAASRDSRLARG